MNHRPSSISPWLALVLVLVLLAPPTHALTLAEAVRGSLERHPDHPRIEARRRVSAGYREQAGSLLGGDPAVNLSATGDTFGSDFGYEEYVAGLSAPVWLPSQRSARGAIAERLARQANSELKKLAWEVSGEVLERAWALRIAQADMKQVMKQWAAARALVHDIRHRYEVGEVSRNDLLLAQQDLVDAESAYQEATGKAQNARLAWRNYTGLNELPEDLERFSHPLEGVGLDQHPELLAALAAVNTAMARAEDARAQRRAPPVVELFAKRDRGSRHEDYTDSLGLAFSLPLGTRAPAAPAIAEAESARTSAQAEANLKRRELELSLARAEQELARAERLLQLAQQKHDYSRDRLRLARRAFELGEMDLYQLLLARRQSNQANRELKRSQLEKARAVARKNHVSGVIPQ